LSSEVRSPRWRGRVQLYSESRCCSPVAASRMPAARGGTPDGHIAARLRRRLPGRTKATTVVIRVAHGPVTARDSQYIDAAPAGPSVGDVRTYYLPLTRPGSTRKIGYLTGTLTTTATGRPRSGMELRAANLVFVLGSAANQLVVGGVAA